jgi:hypothetical protein
MKNIPSLLLAALLVAAASIASAADSSFLNLSLRNATNSGSPYFRAFVDPATLQFEPYVKIDGAAASTGDVSAPASNTAAVITYAAAGAGVSHVISGIAWSYSAAPTGGNLTIEDGSGTTVFTMDITSSGAGFIPMVLPKRGTANTAMIVTLAAGGSAVTGRVNVLTHYTQ